MKPQNIQDKFLNTLRKEKIPVSIIITNGYQIKNALITGYDSFVILITSEDNRQTMLFKHAISSVVPSKHVQLTFDAEGDE